MRITIKIDNVEITISEESNRNDRTVTMKYPDQNKQVQQTMQVMVEEVLKLYAVANSGKRGA